MDLKILNSADFAICTLKKWPAEFSNLFGKRLILVGVPSQKYRSNRRSAVIDCQILSTIAHNY